VSRCASPPLEGEVGRKRPGGGDSDWAFAVTPGHSTPDRLRWQWERVCPPPAGEGGPASAARHTGGDRLDLVIGEALAMRSITVAGRRRCETPAWPQRSRPWSAGEPRHPACRHSDAPDDIRKHDMAPAGASAAASGMAPAHHKTYAATLRYAGPTSLHCPLPASGGGSGGGGGRRQSVEAAAMRIYTSVKPWFLSGKLRYRLPVAAVMALKHRGRRHANGRLADAAPDPAGGHDDRSTFGIWASRIIS